MLGAATNGDRSAQALKNEEEAVRNSMAAFPLSVS
jgi:hypothetical protein